MFLKGIRKKTLKMNTKFHVFEGGERDSKKNIIFKKFFNSTIFNSTHTTEYNC